jgi:hypothetical protein
MGDLLHNLALRTLKPEAGPQPRLRTRFEQLPTVFAPVAKEPETIFSTETRTNQEVIETQQPVTIAQPPPERRPKQPPESREATTPHPTIREIEKPQRVETERVSHVSSPIKLPQVKVRAQPATEARAFPVPRHSLQPRKAAESTQKTNAPREESVERPSAVQVTIGRVEVRAMIQAPQRQSRVTPKQGLMSLDEYLNRRAKGGAS